MYSFKRVIIDKAVYDHDISGYVKYIGYAIPVIHGAWLTEVIYIRELRPPLVLPIQEIVAWSPAYGIWAEIERKTFCGRIIVYDSTEEAIRFLEMLRDRLYSTPSYIETTKDKGFDMKYADISKPKPKNKYYAYHVDITELNSFIEDLRNRTVEFPVEYITTSTATDPIKPEPITEQPKRVTWRWSV